MKQNLLVSVVIPVYNRAHYLAATLNSVFAQTYRPIEVIVVDDGSTDSSAEVAQTYSEVRYFYQSNQGVSVARNVGIAAAQGEFIAFLDADDIWLPDKLSIQIAYMLDHPSMNLTATHKQNFLEQGAQPPSWFNLDDQLADREGIIPSTLVVRRALFERVGGFSPDYRAGEDAEWLYRIKKRGESVVTVPQVLTHRRWHGANLSWTEGTPWPSLAFRLLRDEIARKSNRKSAR